MGHRHITKRSFKVKCRDCGKPILFWECADCGAKTFFSLPIYGKPIRHICDKYLHPQKKPLPPWMTAKDTTERKPLDVKEIGIYQCPVCDKIFSNERGLNNHIHQLKELDENHDIFFNKTLDLIDFSFEDSKMEPSVKLDLKNVEKIGAWGMRLKQKKKKKITLTHKNFHLLKKLRLDFFHDFSNWIKGRTLGILFSCFQQIDKFFMLKKKSFMLKKEISTYRNSPSYYKIKWEKKWLHTKKLLMIYKKTTSTHCVPQL